MSSNSLVPSFRYVTAIPPGAAHETVIQTLKDHDKGITDLQTAIPLLKDQIDELKKSSASSSATGNITENIVNNPIVGLGTINNQSGETSYTTQTQDNGALLVFSDASAIAVTLNTSVDTPWFCFAQNWGAGLVTFTPQSGDINYIGNLAAGSMPLATGYLTLIVFDGTDFWAATISAVTGSGTTGFLPVWTSSTVLGDSHIDDGVTLAGTLTSSEPTLATAGGVVTATLGADAARFDGLGPIPFNFNVADVGAAGLGVIATNSTFPWTQAIGFGFGAGASGTPSTSTVLCFGYDFIANAEFPISIGLGGQIYVVDATTSGFVGINNTAPAFQLDVDGDINTSGLVHSFVYSAAGTPLPPAATAGAGARGFVSDSTVAAAGNFGAGYTSGGANFAPVYCDGANWFIG